MRYFINAGKRKATRGGTTKRKKRKGASMAGRKRKRAKRSTTRRKSTRRRAATKRRAVTTLRRHSVYMTNPRRKRRRTSRRYHRNPSMVRGLIALGKDAGAVLVGGAISRTVSGFIPFGGSPPIDLAKGAVIAVAIDRFGARVVGRDVAHMLAIGALVSPLKNALLAYLPPSVGAFLGSYDLGGIGSYSAIPAPAQGSEMGSYAGDQIYA